MTTPFPIGTRVCVDDNQTGTILYYSNNISTAQPQSFFYGIDWDDYKSRGKHNGTVNGKVHFQTELNSATFLLHKKITPTSNSSLLSQLLMKYTTFFEQYPKITQVNLGNVTDVYNMIFAKQIASELNANALITSKNTLNETTCISKFTNITLEPTTKPITTNTTSPNPHFHIHNAPSSAIPGTTGVYAHEILSYNSHLPHLSTLKRVFLEQSNIGYLLDPNEQCSHWNGNMLDLVPTLPNGSNDTLRDSNNCCEPSNAHNTTNQHNNISHQSKIATNLNILSRFLPSVNTLNLSHNLFNCLCQLPLIISIFPTIESLDLSGNPLNILVEKPCCSIPTKNPNILTFATNSGSDLFTAVKYNAKNNLDDSVYSTNTPPHSNNLKNLDLPSDMMSLDQQIYQYHHHIPSQYHILNAYQNNHNNVNQMDNGNHYNDKTITQSINSNPNIDPTQLKLEQLPCVKSFLTNLNEKLVFQDPITLKHYQILQIPYFPWLSFLKHDWQQCKCCDDMLSMDDERANSSSTTYNLPPCLSFYTNQLKSLSLSSIPLHSRQKQHDIMHSRFLNENSTQQQQQLDHKNDNQNWQNENLENQNQQGTCQKNQNQHEITCEPNGSSHKSNPPAYSTPFDPQSLYNSPWHWLVLLTAVGALDNLKELQLLNSDLFSLYNGIIAPLYSSSNGTHVSDNLNESNDMVVDDTIKNNLESVPKINLLDFIPLYPSTPHNNTPDTSTEAFTVSDGNVTFPKTFFPQLTTLLLNENRLKWESIQSLSQLTSLSDLELNNNNISEILPPSEEDPNQILDEKNIGHENEEVPNSQISLENGNKNEKLPHFPKLRRLLMNSNPLTTISSIKHLKHLSSLEVVSMINEYGEETLVEIAKNFENKHKNQLENSIQNDQITPDSIPPTITHSTTRQNVFPHQFIRNLILLLLPGLVILNNVEITKIERTEAHTQSLSLLVDFAFHNTISILHSYIFSKDGTDTIVWERNTKDSRVDLLKISRNTQNKGQDLHRQYSSLHTIQFYIPPTVSSNNTIISSFLPPPPSTLPIGFTIDEQCSHLCECNKRTSAPNSTYGDQNDVNSLMKNSIETNTTSNNNDDPKTTNSNIVLTAGLSTISINKTDNTAQPQLTELSQSDDNDNIPIFPYMQLPSTIPFINEQLFNILLADIYTLHYHFTLCANPSLSNTEKTLYNQSTSLIFARMIEDLYDYNTVFDLIMKIPNLLHTFTFQCYPKIILPLIIQYQQQYGVVSIYDNLNSQSNNNFDEVFGSINPIDLFYSPFFTGSQSGSITGIETVVRKSINGNGDVEDDDVDERIDTNNNLSCNGGDSKSNREADYTVEIPSLYIGFITNAENNVNNEEQDGKELTIQNQKVLLSTLPQFKDYFIYHLVIDILPIIASILDDFGATDHFNDACSDDDSDTITTNISKFISHISQNPLKFTTSIPALPLEVISTASPHIKSQLSSSPTLTDSFCISTPSLLHKSITIGDFNNIITARMDMIILMIKECIDTFFPHTQEVNNFFNAHTTQTPIISHFTHHYTCFHLFQSNNDFKQSSNICDDNGVELISKWASTTLLQLYKTKTNIDKELDIDNIVYNFNIEKYITTNNRLLSTFNDCNDNQLFNTNTDQSDELSTLLPIFYTHQHNNLIFVLYSPITSSHVESKQSIVQTNNILNNNTAQPNTIEEPSLEEQVDSLIDQLCLF